MIPEFNHSFVLPPFVGEHPSLFVREQCIERYRCDTFLIRLSKQPEKLVQDVRYWYGLFSHRRGDQVWKGMLQLSLQSDDDMARGILDNVGSGD
jgi:hypothetical protein